MKIILSRKGFDSGTGKVPSPILPIADPPGGTPLGETRSEAPGEMPGERVTGQLCSLPIPEAHTQKHNLRYRDIPGEPRLSTLVQDLTGQKVKGSHPVHLDPDLEIDRGDRPPGWRPCFGQAGAAERHLQNQGVGPGDLFLFFGWFRPVELVQRPSRYVRYRYVKNAPDLHVIFGWLQVAERLDIHDRDRLPSWVRSHPHVQGEPYAKADSLYTATEQLVLDGQPLDLPGGGNFPRFAEPLCLSDRNASKRSQWRLPPWFYPFHPGAERTPLSYHGRPDRWQTHGQYTLLQSVGRGQEFVLAVDEYPEAIAWIKSILPHSTLRTVLASDSAVVAKV